MLVALLAPATPLFADVGDLLVFQFYLGTGTRGTGPGEFVFPFGLAIDSAGRFIVSDTESYFPEITSNRIQIFEPDGSWAAEFGGTGDLPGEFWYPTGVAVDARNQIVIADGGNNRIQVFGPAGGTGTPVFLAQFGTYGNYDPLDETSEPGPAPNDRLYFPTSVAVQPGTELFDGTGLGRLAIVDNSNHRVVVLNSELVPLFSFGGYGTDDNLPGTFEYPWGVTINSLGHFYISDPLNHRVQVFDETGQVLWTFGSDETTPIPAPADLSSPSALAFDGAGRLLVADTDRSRILRISFAPLPGGVTATPRCSDVIDSALQGQCHVLASSGARYEALVLGGPGSGEGEFLYAQGVGVDPSGRVVVVDTDQHAVKVFQPASIEISSVVVDAGASGSGQVDLPLTLLVTVANPSGVPLDVMLDVSPSLAGTLTGDRVAPVDAGEDYLFELTFVPEQDGPLTFVVDADGIHLTDARVRADTVTTSPITIVPAAAPKLLVSISTDRPVVGIGDSILATVTLVNSGNTVFDTIAPIVAVATDPAGIVTHGATPDADLFMSLERSTTRELVYEFTATAAGDATFSVSVTATYRDPASSTADLPYPALSDPPLVASTAPVRISADTRPPITRLDVSAEPEPSGWHREPFTVTLTADDGEAGTGVDTITYQVAGIRSFTTVTTASPTDFEIPDVNQGVTTVRFFAADLAGNTESPQTTTFRLDSVPPTIGRVNISPPPGADGWHNTDVVVSFVAGDATSGVASVTPPVTVTTEGPGQVITGLAVDRAGNETRSSVTLNIDKPPILTCRTVSGGVVWPPNHKMVPWVVSVTATDTLSGPVGFVLTAATSSEPDDGRGDGNTTRDIQGFEVGTPDTSGFVRAERSGTGGGRVYSLTYSTSDHRGNVATCTVSTAQVPHDQSAKKKK